MTRSVQGNLLSLKTESVLRNAEGTVTVRDVTRSVCVMMSVAKAVSNHVSKVIYLVQGIFYGKSTEMCCSLAIQNSSRSTLTNHAILITIDQPGQKLMHID